MRGDQSLNNNQSQHAVSEPFSFSHGAPTR